MTTLIPNDGRIKKAAAAIGLAITILTFFASGIFAHASAMARFDALEARDVMFTEDIEGVKKAVEALKGRISTDREQVVTNTQVLLAFDKRLDRVEDGQERIINLLLDLKSALEEK